MSAEALHEEHGHGNPLLHHQFEDMDQQTESYTVGMWSFLVTEIMFFGALFLAYSVYRFEFTTTNIFAEASRELDVSLGFLNTLVLLSSSFFMVMAVRAAQLKNRGSQLKWLFAVVLCACIFLGVKAKEYTHKWETHHIPGPSFAWEGIQTHLTNIETKQIPEYFGNATPSNGSFTIYTNQNANEIDAHHAELFFGIYFVMTGLHGIHVVIGIILMVIMMWLISKNSIYAQDYITLEMAGLYWHFVDIVWIFLFPFLYLIHPAAMRWPF